MDRNCIGPDGGETQSKSPLAPMEGGDEKGGQTAEVLTRDSGRSWNGLASEERSGIPREYIQGGLGTANAFEKTPEGEVSPLPGRSGSENKTEDVRHLLLGRRLLSTAS
jgi:hypothetical protein